MLLSSRCVLLAHFLLVCGCVRAGFGPPQQTLSAPGDSSGEVASGDLSLASALQDASGGSLCAAWSGVALFCEDVDSPDGQLPGALSVKRGTAAVDTGRFFGGRASLRGVTQQSATAGAIVALEGPSSNITVPSGDLYLRAHFLFESPPASPGWLILMESRSRITSANKVAVVVNPDLRLYLGHGSGQSPPGPTLPIGRWFCVELRVSVAKNGGGTAWLDGSQQVATLTGVDTDRGLGHDLFRAGAIVSITTPSLTFNVDDFLVTRDRAGCQ